MENDEEWRDIPGYGGRYQASRDGRVRSVDFEVVRIVKSPGRLLKGHVGQNGYVSYCLYKPSGKKMGALGHRLICETFHGPPPTPDSCVAHGDGTRVNNGADNLRWATLKENQADRIVHGTDLRGRKVWHLCKIGPPDVLEIRRRAETGERYADIAADFGLHRHSISNIVRRKCWKHI